MASKVVTRGKTVLTPALFWDTALEVTEADGAYVKDRRGKKYLDFTCGTATTNIGHCPPRVVQAAKHQTANLIHAGGVFYYESIVRLGEELVDIMPGEINMFFFSNSGAEAVEGAIKLAKYVTKRQAIFAFRGGFHGRTLGCVSLTTSNTKYRKHYHPLLPSVYILPFPSPYHMRKDPETASTECLSAIEDVFKRLITPEEVAGMIIEPVQGEGGYVPAPKEFLTRLRELCTQHGIMLIFDEVQSGFGRTARWFACEHYNVVPDILVAAKGIASGFPLSVVASTRKIMEKWPVGAHGTTFGGNPVSCAASIATIETIKEEGLLERASEMSPYLFERLNQMKNDYEQIDDVRGLGYMIGIEFIKRNKEPDPEAVSKIRAYSEKNGLLLLACGTHGNVIRLIPPLIVTRQQIDEALNILTDSIKKIRPW